MGTLWSKSGQLEFDNSGDPADGCLAYFFEGNTTTSLTTYQNAAETTPHADPLEADANGRWPLVFIPFIATYDVKVVTEGGTQLYYYQNIPNPDVVADVADAVGDDELYATGDIKIRPSTGTLDGYVRLNGRSVGSASSGATERANADTSALYTHLWDNFSNSILAVATGRGASAAADFAANKAIALFDCRSAGLIGLDDMGNTAASLGYGGAFVTGSAIIGGSIGGANTHTLVTGELASHTHSVSITSGNENANHTHSGTTGNQNADHTHSGTTGNDNADHTHVVNGTSAADGAHAHRMLTDKAYITVDRNDPDDNALSNTAGVSTDIGSTDTSATHTHAINITSGGVTANHQHTFTTGTTSANHQHAFTSGGVSANHQHDVVGTTVAAGSGTAHNNIARALHVTLYMKL